MDSGVERSLFCTRGILLERLPRKQHVPRRVWVSQMQARGLPHETLPHETLPLHYQHRHLSEVPDALCSPLGSHTPPPRQSNRLSLACHQCCHTHANAALAVRRTLPGLPATLMLGPARGAPCEEKDPAEVALTGLARVPRTRAPGTRG